MGYTYFMIYSIGLFFIGFYILIKGANWLVDGASSLAQKFHISNFVIGLVIAGIGTSIPEFATFFIGHLTGESEMALGTIIGSNTFNILFILGFSSLVVPLTFKPQWVERDLLWNIIAVSVPAVFVFSSAGGVLSREIGLLMLALFAVWLWIIIKKSNHEVSSEDKPLRIFALPIAVGLILAGLLGVILGGKWVVDGAVEIARLFAVDERFIGLTIVGIGTSFPEFMVTFVAALKWQPGIAIGNIIGSNIFDFLMILGFGALFQPIVFPQGLVVDMVITMLAAAILYGFMYMGEYFLLKRWQGLLMIFFYALYLAYIIGRV